MPRRRPAPGSPTRICVNDVRTEITPRAPPDEAFEMADLNRNLSGFGAVMSPAETAVIDAGLRAYMLRIYAYMGGGLVLGGIAALALSALSVTDDIGQASHVMRAGRVIPVPDGLTVQGRDIL